VLSERMVTPDDLDLLFLTDDPAEAVETVIRRHELRLGETPAGPVKGDAE
jgi:hypothetical protein